jgi:formylglycine-generating enzyme required for sulfatase activity
VNPPELIAPSSLPQPVDSQSGVEADTKEVELKKDGKELFTTPLKPQPPAKGSISIQTYPENATVKILNISPKFYQGIKLSPGDYHLEVSAPGYKSQKKRITLSAGEDKDLSVQLSPAKKFTNSLGMEFVYIEPGSFMMGSPSDETERDDDETQHKVTLTQGYFLQTTELTQGQWKEIMGNNPSSFKDCGANCPVERVSWNDVQDFIKKLNQRESQYNYRLPTEAEWEYAARAGTTTPFSFGRTLSTDQANYNGNYPYGDGSKGIYRKETTPAKSFPPNAWGLYDMHGNVWEWCRDRYGEYPSGNVTDPQGPPSGAYRVLRGGSWVGDAGSCRSANRGRGVPGNRSSNLGFRLVALLVSR